MVVTPNFVSSIFATILVQEWVVYPFLAILVQTHICGSQLFSQLLRLRLKIVEKKAP